MHWGFGHFDERGGWGGVLDGGVFANNPVMCAFAEARQTTFSRVKNPELENMMILSLGTGSGDMDLENYEESGKWSVLKWALNIPNIMMDGAVDTTDFQLRHLFNTSPKLQGNYLRVDFPQGIKKPYSSNMDEAGKEKGKSKSNLEHLVDAGQTTVETAKQELDRFIDQLVEMGPTVTESITLSQTS